MSDAPDGSNSLISPARVFIHSNFQNQSHAAQRLHVTIACHFSPVGSTHKRHDSLRFFEIALLLVRFNNVAKLTIADRPVASE